MSLIFITRPSVHGGNTSVLEWRFQLFADHHLLFSPTRFCVATLLCIWWCPATPSLGPSLPFPSALCCSGLLFPFLGIACAVVGMVPRPVKKNKDSKVRQILFLDVWPHKVCLMLWGTPFQLHPRGALTCSLLQTANRTASAGAQSPQAGGLLRPQVWPLGSMLGKVSQASLGETELLCRGQTHRTAPMYWLLPLLVSFPNYLEDFLALPLKSTACPQFLALGSASRGSQP